MEKISQKIADFLDSLAQEKLRKGILIACSGGRDSMVLLDILKRLPLIPRLGVLYVNHQLRGSDSDKEEAFVFHTIQEKYRLPLFFYRVPPEQWRDCGSIETCARKIRYRFFLETLQRENFGFIATAHHLNDRMETFFLNLLRGGGLQSLAAIPAVNHDIIRPLLAVSRTDIDCYIKEHQISYVEDQTNKQLIYKRNRIRHEVIPLLTSLSGNLENAFQAIFSGLEDDSLFLEQETERRLKPILKYQDADICCLNRRMFLQEPSAIRSRIVKKIGYSFGIQTGRALTSVMIAPGRVCIRKGKIQVMSGGGYLWFFKDDYINSPKLHETSAVYSIGNFAVSYAAGEIFLRRVLPEDEILLKKGSRRVIEELASRGMPATVAAAAVVLVCKNGQIAGYFSAGFFGTALPFYAEEHKTARIFSQSLSCENY